MIRFNFFKKREEEPVKVLELFGGIGACTQAFKRVGIPFEVVDYVEIDKYACKSYNAMNGTDFKPQDICEWDKDIKVDFIMHGSPCQDFSVAGKGLGGDEGSGTRSSLMYETIRIVEKLKPKYVLWENVKNVTGKKHRHNFDKYLVSLQQLGYNNYWQIMNAKDYGIPQNRERVFVLSIRRDIDNGYEFPEPFPLQLRLKDMLDDEVDEKFYLSNKGVNGLLNAFVDGREHKPNLMTNETEYSPTIDTRVGSQTHRSPYIDESSDKIELTQVGQMYGTDKDPKCVPVEPVRLGNIYGEKFGTGYARNVWDKECISPTLMTMQGGNRQPLVIDEGVKAGNTSPSGNYNPSVLVREATKKGYAEAEVGDSVNIGQPNSKTRRGRVGKQVSQTLTTAGGNEMAVVVDE